MSRTRRLLRKYGLKSRANEVEAQAMYSKLNGSRKKKTAKENNHHLFSIEDLYDFRLAFGITKEMGTRERELYRHITVELDTDSGRLALRGNPDKIIGRILEKVKVYIGEEGVLEEAGDEYELVKLFNKKRAESHAVQIWKEELKKIDEDLRQIDASELEIALKKARNQDIELSLSEVATYYKDLFTKK